MEEGLDDLNCVAFFPCKRCRTSVGMAIDRHISAPHHLLLHLPYQPHFLRILRTSAAELLIEGSDVRNGPSGLSGGPLYGLCSGTHPALPFRRKVVSENLRMCDSGVNLTRHQRRRIMSQVGRGRTPNCTETRREKRGTVASTGYARALT